jgi:hypothetical protein
MLEVLPGQPFKGRLDPKATKLVMNFSKLSPRDRLQEIHKGSLELDYDNSPVMRENQIKLNLDPMKIQSEMIAPPQLRFGDGVTVSQHFNWWVFEHTLILA